MKRSFLSVLLIVVSIIGAFAQQAPDVIKTAKGNLTVKPLMHASLMLSWAGKYIYVDPTGDATLFNSITPPDMILITDIHPDHFDAKRIAAINTHDALIIAPQAVADLLPAALKQHLLVLKNGEKTRQMNISIEAIPMYNLPESATAFHTKGRGNGYVLTIGGKRIYISGDTQGTPEMRALKNIYVAFVCMNKPYTMDVTEAADAVLKFKPSIVYPYHYRGQDVEMFKDLVNKKNPAIDVRLRDWYPAIN